MKTKSIYFLMGLIVILIIGGLIFQTYSISEANANINVAVLLPLTGIGAAVGNDFLQGMNLAREEAGNTNIAYFIEDTQTSPKEAVNALNKLLAERDIDLVVALQAQVVAPISAITEAKNIPLIAGLTSIENLTRVNNYVTLVYPLPEDELQKTKEFIQSQGHTRIATLTIMDEFGQTMKTKMEKAYGTQIVASETYPLSETDYRTYLSKIQEQNPDIIFVIGYPTHLINILKQRTELGMAVIPLLSTIHMQSDFVRNATSSLMSEVYAITPAALSKGKNQAFVTQFETTFSRKPDFIAPFGYDIAKIIDAAALSNGASIHDNLRSVSLTGLSGELSFNEYGELNMPLVIVKASDRTIVLQ
ncbi:penicillin-binding protein activator [Candidatus Woesearchaeota archaeon]|nr:penicillin-binding protein activator [Candidatus Woesearchaeota archaeon]